MSTIQQPTAGILSDLVITIVIVAVGRSLVQVSYNHRWLEKAHHARDAIIIKDCVLETKRMLNICLTRERLFAELRGEGIKHLGQVKRLYIEAEGDFSIIGNEEETPGLSVIPEWDAEHSRRQQLANTQLCKVCGAACYQAVAVCSHCAGEE